MSLHPDWIMVVIALLAAGAVGFVHRNQLRTPTAWRRLGAVLCLLLVALRPTAGTTSNQAAVQEVDLLLMIDRTSSMAAIDHDGGQNRLAGVQADASQLIEQYPGINIGVLVFDDSARLEMPFTNDTVAVQHHLEIMGVRDPFYGRGSSISVGVDAAKEALTAAKERNPERARMVIVMSDGEQTVDTAPESFEPLAELVDQAYVFGYGTEQGATMIYEDKTVKDNKAQDGISKLDPANLQAMADQLGGEYQLRTGAGEVDVQLPEATTVDSDQQVETGFPLYWLPALVMVALVVWEGAVEMRRHQRLRQELM